MPPCPPLARPEQLRPGRFGRCACRSLLCGGRKRLIEDVSLEIAAGPRTCCWARTARARASSSGSATAHPPQRRGDRMAGAGRARGAPGASDGVPAARHAAPAAAANIAYALHLRGSLCRSVRRRIQEVLEATGLSALAPHARPRALGRRAAAPGAGAGLGVEATGAIPRRADRESLDPAADPRGGGDRGAHPCRVAPRASLTTHYLGKRAG